VHHVVGGTADDDGRSGVLGVLGRRRGRGRLGVLAVLGRRWWWWRRGRRWVRRLDGIGLARL
jgi:hypothetical protein